MLSNRVTGMVRSGMTLAEVLVAAIVLGVGVAGLLEVGAMSLRNQQRVEHRTAAMYMAQEKIAQVEILGPYAWTQDQPTRGVDVRNDIAYDWSLTIEALDVGQLYRVLVQVAWQAPGSSGHVELETWLNDYDQEEPTWAQEQRGPGAAGTRRD